MADEIIRVLPPETKPQGVMETFYDLASEVILKNIGPVPENYPCEPDVEKMLSRKKCDMIVACPIMNSLLDDVLRATEEYVRLWETMPPQLEKQPLTIETRDDLGTAANFLESRLDCLDSIPELNKTSGDWIDQTETVAREGLKNSSVMKSLRAQGEKSWDGLRGIDKSRRMWRKESEESRTIWYYVPSLLRNQVSKVNPIE